MDKEELKEKDVFLSDNDIDCIMDLVLDGACSYWCDTIKTKGKRLGKYISEQISLGGELLFSPYEEEWDGEAWFSLNKDNFMKGVKMYIEDTFDYCEPITCGNGVTLDAADADDLVADAVIQYALFDELVFG